MSRMIAVFMLIVSVMLTGCFNGNGSQCRKIKIVAHRGASFVAPENTVASTVLAFEKKADISEIDVYLSQDHRMIVIHDKTTKRTAGVDLTVAETDSDRLRELEVGTFKSSEYTGEKIPFIEEIIAVIPRGKKLFIEIKCGPEIVPYLKKAIENSGREKRMEIIAGSMEVLTACGELLPALPRYWVLASKKDKDTGKYLPYEPGIIDQAVAARLTGLDLHYMGLTPEFAQQVHQAGLELYVWTVNDEKAAQTMCTYGVDGITTDKPDTIRAALKNQTSSL